MKVIFGLGNPGRQYKDNRHNVGRRVVEHLADSHNLEFKRSFKTSSYIAKKKDLREWVFLVKLRVFMNNSGPCLKKVLHRYGVSLPDILVIYDDVDLPLGKIRFKAKGSSAGHRGMASIITALNDERINRLRVGIGTPRGQDLSEYVLSDFSGTEKEAADIAVRKAAVAAWDWVDTGIDSSMQKNNRREDQSNSEQIEEDKQSGGGN